MAGIPAPAAVDNSDPKGETIGRGNTPLIVAARSGWGAGKMIGRATATARLENMGDSSALRGEQSCGADSCQGVRAVTLGDENLCCDHFLSRCYELLERIDPESRITDSTGPLNQETKELVDEYSRHALEVSLGSTDLNNLQRARLLDVLLWASDISTGTNSRKTLGWKKAAADSAPRADEKDPSKASNWRTSISY